MATVKRRSKSEPALAKSVSGRSGVPRSRKTFLAPPSSKITACKHYSNTVSLNYVVKGRGGLINTCFALAVVVTFAMLKVQFCSVDEGMSKRKKVVWGFIEHKKDPLIKTECKIFLSGCPHFLARWVPAGSTSHCRR